MATKTEHRISNNSQKQLGLNGRLAQADSGAHEPFLPKDKPSADDDDADYDNVDRECVMAARAANAVNSEPINSETARLSAPVNGTNSAEHTGSVTGSCDATDGPAVATGNDKKLKSSSSDSKSDKKGFSWGKKKEKKKPKTAAEWSALAAVTSSPPAEPEPQPVASAHEPAVPVQPVSPAPPAQLAPVPAARTSLRKTPEEKPEKGTTAVKFSPAENNYYGSESSLSDDQKIPDTPDTPIGHVSFWACCAGAPRMKPKSDKKAQKERERKEKQERKEKLEKEKREKKLLKGKKKSDDNRHSLPAGFQCNGGDDVTPVVVGGNGAGDGKAQGVGAQKPEQMGTDGGPLRHQHDR